MVACWAHVSVFVGSIPSSVFRYFVGKVAEWLKHQLAKLTFLKKRTSSNLVFSG